MKYFSVIFLFLGIGIGLFLGKPSHPPIKDIDVSIGEFLYEELSRYPKEWNLPSVVKILQELDTGKRLKQPIKQRDDQLIALCAKESEQVAENNLEQAEAFLNQLAKKEQIQIIVPNKVFVEVLQEGFGEQISLEDAIVTTFQQENMQGEILKTTDNKTFTIFLEKTIKGFQKGIQGACVGERRKIYIHPEYGFGQIGRSQETNQLLIYEICISDKVTKN